MVFNIRHNRYRLIVAVHYAKVIDGRLTLGHVYIGSFMTHKEYDRWCAASGEEEGGMATLLANPAKMIERGAPHLIRSEEQLAAYTKALYRLTAEPRPTPAQVEAIELLTLLDRTLRGGALFASASLSRRRAPFSARPARLEATRSGSGTGRRERRLRSASGKRKLNAAHIEQLSKRFQVSPAVFFPAI